jgi:hypothetical protein
MRVGRAAGWVAVLLSALGPTVGAASAAPAHTIRADVSGAGVIGNTAVDEDGIAMSANGGLIAFASPASNLVAGDTNGMRDVFVRNLRTGATTRVDLGPGGVQADGDSFGPLAMSGDGRFVAFESDSSNLAPGSGCSPGQAPDCLFVRDRLHGTTRAVKRIPNPGILALSQHGRYLVAAGLVTPLERIDLHTNAAGVISCCGLGSDLKNLQFDGMSANANLVAFSLNAGPSDRLHPKLSQVCVRNIARHTTTLVSKSVAGVPGNSNSIGGAMSPGGRYVFFTSAATDLVPGDTNRQTSCATVAGARPAGSMSAWTARRTAARSRSASRRAGATACTSRGRRTSSPATPITPPTSSCATAGRGGPCVST